MKGKSAFDWDIYKNRKSALQYLKRHRTLVDLLIETENGSMHDYVHTQVISAFGDKFTNFILNSGQLVRTCYYNNRSLKSVRLPRVNDYTLKVLIECAYTGYIRTDLASGGIWQVLDVADYYDMKDVIKACCTFLAKNLNVSNCVHLYHIGIRYNHPLLRSAWHKIRANFKHILAQNLLDSNNDLVQNGILGPNWDRCNVQSPIVSVGGRVGANQYQPRARVQQSTRANATTADNAGASSSASGAGPSVEAGSFGSPMDTDADLVAAANNLREQKRNNLATIKLEHFEPMLMHDKLNIDNEESVWSAIKLWCNYDIVERSSKVPKLLPCMRFPRFRTGVDFPARHIWRDPLVIGNRQAQQQLAVLDRNHRDFLSGQHQLPSSRDGFNLPCAVEPRQLRPRVPHSILLAIGGWQQGQPTTLIESYDVNCNLWFESKRRIMAPLAYHGIEYINGLLYICGGTDGSEILSELFTFDPVRGDCAQKPSMRDSRCYVSTAKLDGHLYAMGGHNGVQRMRSVERFNLIDETWNHIQEMNVARSDASACVYNSYIYIAGGLNDQAIESSIEFYNSTDNSWTFIASMMTQRTSFTLLAYQNSLLAIGGNNGSERLNTVEQYSFSTKIWTPHSQMRHRRSTFSAALVDETKLIVVGGYNGQTPFSQVEMFDSTTGAWIPLHKIRHDRSGLRVVVVDDLPNATEYTFLGSQGHNYISADDKFIPQTI